MKKFIKIMTGFMNRMAQDHVSAFAAQAAFFILMSFVPFLMLLLPLVTYVSITKDMVVEMILQVMPDAGDFRSFLLSIIQEVYDKVIAEKFIFEKKLIVIELKKYGIHSVLTQPENLTLDTINKYLEIKARGIL